MKKAITVLSAIILALVMTFSMAGCGESGDVSEVIKIGALNGPTGMGLVQLMDQTDKYDIKIFESPDKATGKIMSGELDVAAVPSNVASVLYNKTKGKIMAISPVTLGVLYVLENGDSTIRTAKDLKDRTIYASGKGSIPEYALEVAIEDAGLKMSDVNVKWLANHSDVQQSFLKDKGSLALLPEPFVTITETKVNTVRTALDLTKLWKKAIRQDLTMGVLIAQKSFVEERGEDLDVLIQDYDASVNFVNDKPAEAAKLIAKWGFIPKEKIAEKAIPNCNIVFYKDMAEAKDVIDVFNKELFELNPKAIGGAVPGDDFYRVEEKIY